jgi:peroxiredoxin
MAVEVGDMAPDFELSSHNDRKVKLSDFRGTKNVFIAFYPLAWTPV